jgi:hypothetical protein
MNRADSQLQRLFRAAAAAGGEFPSEAPFWMENQILAELRMGAVPDPSVELIPLYRGAFACACAIILISAILTLRSANEAPPNEWVIVDTAVQLTFMQ